MATTGKPAVLVPPPQADWALFLDLDGTLLDIAARPQDVVVPPDLVADLTTARDWLGGALAIVSGRRLDDLDRLLEPLRLDCGAEHGALLRRSGVVEAQGRAVPPAWRAQIERSAQAMPGVLVEDKHCGIAVHYRQAPHHAAEIEAMLRALVATDNRFAVLPARMAFELRDAQVNKGSAVRTFLQAPPFAGRKPVFVGDDTTDEDGMREAESRNGLGLHVARVFGGTPANVREWLKKTR